MKDYALYDLVYNAFQLHIVRCNDHGDSYLKSKTVILPFFSILLIVVERIFRVCCVKFCDSKYHLKNFGLRYNAILMIIK